MEDNAYAGAKMSEKIDLSNFRSRLEKLNVELTDLRVMMQKIADSNFGPQPSETDQQVSPPVDTTNDMLREVEKEASRLRQHCNRF